MFFVMDNPLLCGYGLVRVFVRKANRIVTGITFMIFSANIFSKPSWTLDRNYKIPWQNAMEDFAPHPIASDGDDSEKMKLLQSSSFVTGKRNVDIFLFLIRLHCTIQPIILPVSEKISNEIIKQLSMFFTVNKRCWYTSEMHTKFIYTWAYRPSGK